ncbi:ester cyclase [Solitalea lacus]|uniref:ester cyclase n=1 Tax=Solitalea lacus TaxID=2911172 RepID=UPI001EDA2535|nr:ester cyclase [Solitalea lacus]UKJ09302.1 ester cyclase [Solitalea lacus]
MKNIKNTVLFQWFDEVWNQGNEESIDKLMAENSNAHGIIQEGQPNGASGFKIFYREFRKDFKDIKIEVEDVICHDNIECARTNVTARHEGTNSMVNFSGICWVMIVGGKIVEAWNSYDFLELYKQIGLIKL